MTADSDGYSSLVIGLGQRGKLHVQALCQYQNKILTPVATYDRRRSNRISPGELEDVISLDTLQSLNTYSALQLVIIATPPTSHYDYALKYVNSSSVLLLEKPAVNSYRELLNLTDRAAHTPSQMFIGYSERVNPLAKLARRRVQDLVRQGIVSRLTLIRFRALPPGPWRDVGQELAVHDLDFVLNDLFPREHVVFQRLHQPGRLVLTTFLANVHVSVSILSEWVNPGAEKTEMVMELKTGELERVTIPIGDQRSRLSALRAQLDRIFNSGQESYTDLNREQRVLKVLYEN